MSVKVTTPSQTGFIRDDRSPLKTQDMSLANKLDSIASNITLECPRSLDTSDQSKRERLGSSSTKNTPIVKKWRRASEKGGPTTPHVSSNKKRTPKFEKQKEKIKLPTKFLLGGNINDPLNLNSMNDAEINKALNAETPVSSPLPTPSHRHQKVEVLIPPNINDPLNLNSGEDIDMSLVSPRGLAKKRKKNKRKKSTEPLIGEGPDTLVQELQQPEKDFSTELTLKIDTKVKTVINEIVSPAIPQDSPKPKRKRTVSEPKVSVEAEIESPTKGIEKPKMKKTVSVTATTCKPPVFRPSDKKFTHGNYNRYYGKRNPEMEQDERLGIFQKEWFDGKDVLDIGCNIGHVTLSLARDFGPRNITGMDIDSKLISIARKNVQHYISSTIVNPSKFPVSLPSTHGAIAAPVINQNSKKFPDNINFVQGNYVLDSDELLDLQKEEYDVILALSITKWLHLNYGDDGLKRCFKRMFRQLRPGGKLILEPQSWSSYKKKKKLSETIWKNYRAIELKPDRFKSYLLGEVGFSKSEYLDVPFNKSKGFQRPILLLTKPDTSYTTPREVIESRGVTPLMDIECGHHVYTPRFTGFTGTPTNEIHPSYSFSSTHMPIRGCDAFLEAGMMTSAFTPTQELIAVAARGATPRFDIGTPSVSARNTPSQPLHFSDAEDHWSQEGVELFEHLSHTHGELDTSCSSRSNSQDHHHVNTATYHKESLSQTSYGGSSLTSSQNRGTDSQEISSSQQSSIAVSASSLSSSQSVQASSSTCESSQNDSETQPSSSLGSSRLNDIEKQNSEQSPASLEIQSSDLSQRSSSSATSSQKQGEVASDKAEDSCHKEQETEDSLVTATPEKSEDSCERSDSKVDHVKDSC